MAATPVDDISDDSALECDFGSVSDEETIDIASYCPVSQLDETLFDVERPETDSFARRRCTTVVKKPRKHRRTKLAKCTTAAATDNGNRKSPVTCQNMPVSTYRATSGATSTNRRSTELNQSMTSVTSRKDRMLMRSWLVSMADRKMIANLSWFNEERTQIKINWKHGSRSCWTLEDCQLFREWAKHTGKLNESKGDEPKRWKANFRCALNSLPDVVEVKNVGQTKGNSPYKVYELLQQVNKRTSPRKPKRTRRSKLDKQLSQAATTVLTPGRKMSAPSLRQSRISDQENVTQRNVTLPATQQPPSQVIPTVVEEMSDISQDDWTTAQSSYNETSEAIGHLQSEYRRLNSSSPSESSGYVTDSSGVLDRLDCTNIFPECSSEDFDVPIEYAMSSEMPEFNIEETHAYHQLQLQDPFGYVTYYDLR